MQSNKRKNIYILALTLVVVMLGFGLVIPIIPFYVEQLGAGGSELGLLVASYAIMRLIFGPVWGSLSDRIGRKPVLMIGMLGYAVTMFWFGLATELWMLFLARTLSGILSSATSPTTMAYISDSTSEDERGRGMGILGAAIGVGTILGPGLGGLLAGDTSLSLPFFIAGGASLLSLLLIALFLPESLPHSERQRGNGKPGSLQIREMWEALSSPLGILMGMAFLASFALTVFFAVFGLYALDKFGYGPQQVGLVFMLVGLVTALGQGGLTGPLTRRWGEALVIKVCLFFSVLGFMGIALARSDWIAFLTIGFFALTTALLTPAVTALTSKHTQLQQGITMGLSNAFMSLGRIVGPLAAGFLYDVNISYPYVFGAVVMFLGFLASLTWVTQNPRVVLHAQH